LHLRGKRDEKTEEKILIMSFMIIMIIRRMKSWGMRCNGHATRVRKLRNEYNRLVGKFRGERPLGRNLCKWKDNIEKNQRKMW
jgi:hypothetical protein